MKKRYIVGVLLLSMAVLGNSLPAQAALRWVQLEDGVSLAEVPTLTLSGQFANDMIKLNWNAVDLSSKGYNGYAIFKDGSSQPFGLLKFENNNYNYYNLKGMPAGTYLWAVAPYAYNGAPESYDVSSNGLTYGPLSNTVTVTVPQYVQPVQPVEPAQSVYPDLSVSIASFERVNNIKSKYPIFRVVVQVQNIGDADISGDIRFQYSADGSNNLKYGYISKSGLAKGALVKKTLVFRGLQGAHTFSFAVDVANLVKEKNESNNRVSMDYTTNTMPAIATPKVTVSQKSTGSQIFEAGQQGVALGTVVLSGSTSQQLDSIVFSCTVPTSVLSNVKLTMDGTAIGSGTVAADTLSPNNSLLTFSDLNTVVAANQPVFIQVVANVSSTVSQVYNVSCGVKKNTNISMTDVSSGLPVLVEGRFGLQTPLNYIVPKVQ